MYAPETAGSTAALIVVIPLQLLATPLPGPEPSGFSVPGAATITNTLTGATTLAGDLGVAPRGAIAGKATITVNGSSAALAGNPSVHEADAVAALAQVQLASATTGPGPPGHGTLDTFAALGCARALANVEGVDMDGNTLSIGCADTAYDRGRGSSGGLDVPPGGVVPVRSPFIRMPEPAVLLLFAAGLLAACCLHTRHDRRRRQPRSDASTGSAHGEPRASASTG